MMDCRPAEIILLLTAALGLAACATLQPPSATGPRASEPTYPLLYTADDTRLNAATAAIGRLLQPANAENAPALQPITLTVESLGPNPRQLLYLPRLGTAPKMTEEETRESLRRFIGEWQDLIGSDPAKLSLVERVDQPDGTRLATYEQRPFRYPIRGGFGKFQIRFANDRRVVSMVSTCIPDADRIQTLLSGISAKSKPEDVTNRLLDNPIPYIGNAAAAQQSFRVASATQVHPQELVIYIRTSKIKPDALEFHIAWEVEVSGAPFRRTYVDAVTNEIIAAE